MSDEKDSYNFFVSALDFYFSNVLFCNEASLGNRGVKMTVLGNYIDNALWAIIHFIKKKLGLVW